MTSEKLNRINELARKAKSEGLSPAETAERDRLRKEYIAEYRASLRSQLDNMYVLDKDGNEIPIKKKTR